MNSEYIGKTCPFCRTEFQEGDDIVVCSACDMPHHKECWVENKGCTTFGCSGTIKTVDGEATSVTSETISYEEEAASESKPVTFCTKCGASNEKTATFCVKCGNKLGQTQSAPTQNTYTQQNYGQQGYQQPGYQQPGYQQPGYQQQAYQQQGYVPAGTMQFAGVDPDVVQLVNAKTHYYIPRFQRMKAQNSKASWNWCAFLFSAYWFMYRKMYAYGAITLAVMFVLAQIPGPFFTMVGLVINIVIGIMANSLYMAQVEKYAQQAKTMYEPQKSEFIRKNGGKSGIAAILTLVGYAALLGIMQ